MNTIAQQRPYVDQAISAARVAFEIYRAKPSRDADAVVAFEAELARVTILAAEHGRGETTLSAVVYPARKLAYAVEDAIDRIDAAS